jgi:hypothetical protein
MNDPEQFPRNPIPPGSGPEGNPTPVGPGSDEDAGPLTTHPARPFMPEAIPSTMPDDDADDLEPADDPEAEEIA